MVGTQPAQRPGKGGGGRPHVRTHDLHQDRPRHRGHGGTPLNSEEVSGVIGRQKGHRFHYLLWSVAEPTDYASVTAWDSREDAEAYERSGTYEELTGKFMQFYTRPPQLRSYEVVGGE